MAGEIKLESKVRIEEIHERKEKEFEKNYMQAKQKVSVKTITDKYIYLVGNNIQIIRREKDETIKGKSSSVSC